MARGSRAYGFFRGKSDRRETGNAMALYALGVIPILCVIGIGVDLSNGWNARNHVQDALDAAVRSAARLAVIEDDAGALSRLVEREFLAGAAGFSQEMTCQHTVVAPRNTSALLTATVDCTLASAIIPVFGDDGLSFTRSASAPYGPAA